MKTCLITGGAGFIGSHLARRLLKDYKVMCIDNLSSGDKKNVQDLTKNKNFVFLEHDIKKPIELKEIDYVFHLASRASPADFSKYPIDILLTNSLGTYNMLELARKNKARFLFASSSEVYGDPKEHPQKETYYGNVNPTGERSCYDEAKRFGEAIAINFSRGYGVDVRIARIFNTFGPCMRKDDGRVIPNFITSALNGLPITVFGDGKQTRSFCYVDDMVEGLCRLMFKENISERIFNIGSSEETKIIEVAKLIKKLTGSKSEIVFKPMPKDDPSRRKPDLAKIKNLDWKPKVGLEEGLKKTIEWFRESLS